MTPINPPAIIIHTPVFEPCACPECKRLDAEHPGGGYQLALFPCVPSLPPVRCGTYALTSS